MARLTILKRKEKLIMEIVILIILTLLNMGLVVMVLSRINNLRRDLRTPVVKKFNPDFGKSNSDFGKRKSVDISKEPDKKEFRPNRNSSQPTQASGKPKGPQSARPNQVRRSALKAPDVFSNEVPAIHTPVPPRPTMSEPMSEGRRPLPPRSASHEPAHQAFGTAPADLAPIAPAPIIPVQNDDDGIELDRSKMTHGRRNMVKKAIIDDDDADNKGS